MDLKYWDKAFQDYEHNILSIYDQDIDGTVLTLIQERSREKGIETAADMGCGIGKFSLSLSKRFKQVDACDFSERSLSISRERCRNQENIHFHRLDLTADRATFEPVDFVLCTNVLIMPDFEARMKAWRTVTNQVKLKGYLLLVVPALEALWMQNHQDMENLLNEGYSCQEALAASIPNDSTALDMHQGVYRLDSVRTKHYLKAELEAMLKEHHFELISTQKLLYQNKAHSNTAKNWDWLTLAQRLPS